MIGNISSIAIFRCYVFNGFKRSFFFIFRSYREGGKRSIFAVNTVALVVQHADYISRHTGLKCKGYSGDMNVDFWQEQQWLDEIEEHEVLIYNIDLL